MKESDSNPVKILAWPSGRSTDLNPYVRLMYQAFRPPAARLIPFRASMLRLPQADVFHIQWPEAIFWGVGRHHAIIASILALNVLRAADHVRRSGGMVVQTIHNLHPHARLSPLGLSVWHRYRAALLSRTDALIGLTASSLNEYRALFPRAAQLPAFILPHPHYRAAYPQPPTRDLARQMLQISNNDFVFGMIGSVRASKGVPDAVYAFRKSSAAGERLLIAGACEDDRLWDEICSAQENDPRLSAVRRHLSDTEIASAVAACDIILLNQGTTFNSGTALLALSLNRPLIAPAQGSLVELAQQLGDEWVALFKPPLDELKLRKCVSQLKVRSRSSEAPLQDMAPDILSERLLAVFQRRFSPD